MSYTSYKTRRQIHEDIDCELNKMLDLIGPDLNNEEGSWIQGYYDPKSISIVEAQDKRGTPTNPNTIDAIKWSFIGSYYRATSFELEGVVGAALKESILKKYRALHEDFALDFESDFEDAMDIKVVLSWFSQNFTYYEILSIICDTIYLNKTRAEEMRIKYEKGEYECEI